MILTCSRIMLPDLLRQVDNAGLLGTPGTHAWTEVERVALIDSVLRGHPIGEMLTCGKHPRTILDGRERIAALGWAFLGYDSEVNLVPRGAGFRLEVGPPRDGAYPLNMSFEDYRVAWEAEHGIEGHLRDVAHKALRAAHGLSVNVWHTHAELPEAMEIARAMNRRTR